MRSDHLSKHLKIHKKNSFNQQNQVKQENDSENGTSISGLMDWEEVEEFIYFWYYLVVYRVDRFQQEVRLWKFDLQKYPNKKADLRDHPNLIYISNIRKNEFTISNLVTLSFSKRSFSTPV